MSVMRQMNFFPLNKSHYEQSSDIHSRIEVLYFMLVGSSLRKNVLKID